MKNRSLILMAALVPVTWTGLVGCDENVTSPSVQSPVAGTVIDEGRLAFEAALNEAIRCLSLGEVAVLTPYIAGDKRIEEASLEEVIAVTPVVVKFQKCFDEALSRLSLSDILKISQYMKVSGKNRYPFPDLETDSVIA